MIKDKRAKNKKRTSALEAFLENSRQMNSALQEGKRMRAYAVEYTDLTGKTHMRYWNGAAYSDRKSHFYDSLEKKEMNGIYKARFDESKLYKN